ncbi:hypothetical protein AV545_03670 [Paenibacillus jamilae]|uniref:hypothetical protein n=1 Tax=Paenibacillus jamilae TaxID=114136 RepID=UPI0007ABBC53|nr:hypothetical protein [Paenibacillus jamilae]KZE65030.1 hypothetical protein AV545_03670 [Paenibacillus jamilae]
MTKIAIVKHNGSQTPYAFYTDLDLKKGDLVVCDTARGYETGRVVDIGNTINCIATKWIVAKVDMRSHENRVLKKIVKEKRISRINERINLIKNKYSQSDINYLISRENEEMGTLLKELDELLNRNDNNKTNNEIELKNSFYFKNRNGGIFIAFKSNKDYIVKSISYPYATRRYSIDAVKEWIRLGYWKLNG